MSVRPLPLTHAQDWHPVIHAAINVLMEAVCLPLIIVCGCFVLFFFVVVVCFVSFVCFVSLVCFVFGCNIYLVGLVVPFFHFFPFLFLSSMSVISAWSPVCIL